MAAVGCRFHKVVADILEDNLGKEAGFAVDFEAFVHLVEPDLADSNWFGYKLGMDLLAELEQGLGFLARSFYEALRL